jgi:hypothetical protein
MPEREHVLLAAFSALESAHFYSAFLPSVMTIRKFAKDPEALEALRKGEAIATGFAVMLGWVVSELVDSYLPLVFTAVTAVAMLAVYEYAIRGNAMEGARAAAVLGIGALLPVVPPAP